MALGLVAGGLLGAMVGELVDPNEGGASCFACYEITGRGYGFLIGGGAGLLAGTILPVALPSGNTINCFGQEPRDTPAETADSILTTTDLSPPVQSAFCFCGRPKPYCSTFMITEFGMMYRVSGAGVNGYYWNDWYDDWEYVGYSDNDFVDHLAGHLEIGLMTNTGRRSAVGATLTIALEDDRHRAGIKGRYRYWQTRNLALDLGIGALKDLKGTWWIDELNRRNWFVGSFGVSWKELLQFSLQYETYEQSSRNEERINVLYAGVRTGGGLGLPLAAAAFVTTVAISFAADS
jgi:hypothetical protein